MGIFITIILLKVPGTLQMLIQVVINGQVAVITMRLNLVGDLTQVAIIVITTTGVLPPKRLKGTGEVTFNLPTHPRTHNSLRYAAGTKPLVTMM